MCQLDEYCHCEINVYANRKVIKGILEGSISLSETDPSRVHFCLTHIMLVFVCMQH